MLSVKIDHDSVRKVFEDKIEKAFNDYDKDMVFWDTKELKRRTCMSWGTIQEQFFHDARFPKAKLGGKWYFPARECRIFLETWFDECKY